MSLYTMSVAGVVGLVKALPTLNRVYAIRR